MSVCWLCGEEITDPPMVIGQIVAGVHRVAHRRCWQSLGEAELELSIFDPGKEIGLR